MKHLNREVVRPTAVVVSHPAVVSKTKPWQELIRCTACAAKWETFWEALWHCKKLNTLRTLDKIVFQTCEECKEDMPIGIGTTNYQRL